MREILSRFQSRLAVMASFPFHSRRERDLDDEIRAHIEMAVEERVTRGESRADAERAVRREFGDAGRVKEVTRTMWGGMWLDRLGQDLRFGVRSLIRDRGFSIAAILVLVAGIGANAIVFTLANGIFFEGPPGVSDPSELVGLQWIQADGGEQSWAYVDFEFVRERSTAFSDVLAYTGFPLTAAMRRSDAPPSPADGWAVSHNFFDLLGTRMALGRGFLSDEGETVGTHPVVVLHHAFWQSDFGEDSGILGRTVSVNGLPFTVVGVTPREFRGISPVEVPPDFYVPIMMQGALVPGWGEIVFDREPGSAHTWLKVVGRLEEGATLETARADLVALQGPWEEAFGDWASITGIGVGRMDASADPGFFPGEGERLRGMLGFLAAVAGAVLLIGCANLAILLLARASARDGEMGVRTALGAGRGRLLRQLLTESAILAGFACVAGVALAYWGSGLVASLLPFYFAAEMRPDGAVVLGTIAVTLVVTGAFSLAPALRLARAELSSTLRREGRATTGSRSRNLLVVGQVAAAVVLVVGAGLFGRSVVAAGSVPLGFDPESRLVMSVQLGNHGYDAAGVRAFRQDVLDRMRAIPGVTMAALMDRPPFNGRWTSTIRPIGTEYEEDGVTLAFNRVGAGYFETMGVEIVAGRALTDLDDVEGVHNLVIGLTAAERLWPGQEGVGQQFSWRDAEWTVVGVAEDAKYAALGENPIRRIYVPQGQVEEGNVTFVLRTAVPARTVASAAERAIHDVDPAVAVFGVQTLEELVDGQTRPYRAMAVLVGLFGSVALFLAAVGLYGVQAYLVGRRSKEIGIRMALGAKAKEVASSILRRGALLSGLGIVIGLTAAFALARVVEGMLFGIQPRDPLTFAGVALVLLAVSLAASYVPARRAAGVDPMRVLREE